MKGIEIAESLVILSITGCDYGQGDFLYLPLPEQNLVSFIKLLDDTARNNVT